MRLKLLRWLIIPFLCIVLMSHNTFAADISLQARPIWSNLIPSFTCLVYTVGVYNNECINLNSDITVSVSDFTFIIPEGINITSATTVMQVELLFDNYQDNNSIDGNFLRARFQSGNFGLIDVSSSSQGSTGYMVRLTFIAERSFTTRASDNSNRYTVYNPLNQTELAYLKPGERMVISNVGLYNLSGDGTQAIVNAINNNNTSSVTQQQGQAIVNAINNAQQKEDEAVDNIESQTPSSISSAGGSGENQQTSSLLATLDSFLQALQGLSATNCNVTLNMPSFAGGAMTVNVCQNKEYTGNIVSIVGSIMLVVFYLPVAIMLVSKIYSEIRSFTNG